MQNVHSDERFIEVTLAATFTLTDFIGPGVLFDLKVPADAPLRHIWIAAGAFLQQSNSDHWFMQGKLNFYFQGENVGKLDFSDASAELSSSEKDIGVRKPLRIRPDGTGSTQPALRYQEFKSTLGTPYERDNLDLSAFTLGIVCDRIEYEMEKCYATGSATILKLLYGLKVVSSQN